MAADFWAGYISGAVGILIGNPLDIVKFASSPRNMITGATAPILGYGVLNALLFVTYNRTSARLNSASPNFPLDLWTTFFAGATGGLATWVISTPTELIKCRAQTLRSPIAATSWRITKNVLRTEGVSGLYFGGVVTALRDSIGYGFYFWSYEMSTRLLAGRLNHDSAHQGAVKVLLCGGLAGVITWASVFPLDVIKTRVQTQVLRNKHHCLVGCGTAHRLGAMDVARSAYRHEGASVFFRGLGVCSVRAFIVNAAQWTVYEWLVRELDPGRNEPRLAIAADVEIQRIENSLILIVVLAIEVRLRSLFHHVTHFLSPCSDSSAPDLACFSRSAVCNLGDLFKR